ncbi:MAG TPA: hypothetical protein VFK57_25125 [Vicinamibacterales bacterium]|nr:hypothetical protein [Vicinamibacterales bacterium]
MFPGERHVPAAAGREVNALRPDPKGAADGDVLVTSHPESPPVFTVRQVPSTAQVRAGSRDEAIALARAFAVAHAVDVWFDDNGAFRLLEAYRPRSAAR